MTESPQPHHRSDVWIVEDNELLREEIRRLIDGEPTLACGFAGARCEDALALIESGEVPDIVLMDIGLPGIDGIEGTRRIRSLSPTTRVVMLTIHEEDEKVIDAVRAGANGYLLKPSDPKEIIAGLQALEAGQSPINGFIAGRMLEIFAALARSNTSDKTGHDLTAREREILKLLVDGLSTRQIAERLSRSYHTIDNHIRNIYDKLHVHSRAAAISRAVRDRIV